VDGVTDRTKAIRERVTSELATLLELAPPHRTRPLSKVARWDVEEVAWLLAENDRLRDAGRALATCAFNLKQRDHLTDNERRSLAESQEAWDRGMEGS
jgi:hypothetical protein